MRSKKRAREWWIFKRDGDEMYYRVNPPKHIQNYQYNKGYELIHVREVPKKRAKSER